MTKRILDVGNCSADHSSITQMIENHFDAAITQAHGSDDAIEALGSQTFDLVLVNRLMDRTGSSGLDIIKRIKSDDQLGSTSVMMITNFDEHQQLAIEAGAERGFGKQALNLPKTVELLQPYLG